MSIVLHTFFCTKSSFVSNNSYFTFQMPLHRLLQHSQPLTPSLQLSMLTRRAAQPTCLFPSNQNLQDLQSCRRPLTSPPQFRRPVTTRGDTRLLAKNSATAVNRRGWARAPKKERKQQRTPNGLRVWGSRSKPPLGRKGKRN